MRAVVQKVNYKRGFVAYETEDYDYSCLFVPIISLGLFVICVLVTFIYLAMLLSWKDVDKEENNHESSGSESEL